MYLCTEYVCKNQCTRLPHPTYNFPRPDLHTAATTNRSCQIPLTCSRPVVVLCRQRSGACTLGTPTVYGMYPLSSSVIYCCVVCTCLYRLPTAMRKLVPLFISSPRLSTDLVSLVIVTSLLTFLTTAAIATIEVINQHPSSLLFREPSTDAASTGYRPFFPIQPSKESGGVGTAYPFPQTQRVVGWSSRAKR